MRGQHSGSAKAASSSMRPAPPDWRQFERNVVELLTLQGYNVASDRRVGGRQTDLIARLSHGSCELRILVECKYHQGHRAVGVGEVSGFCSRVNGARASGQVDKGLLVTNTRFTRDAFDCVAAQRFDPFISLITCAELESSLMDFRSYARGLVDDFTRDPLSRYMVDLACTTPEGSRCSSISEFVSSWLGKPDQTQMCILGDYGTGKTSFCLYLSSELAQRYIENPDAAPIPVLIFLREYSKAGSVKAMVTDWLVNDCGVPNARYRLFRRMLEAGRFVLLLDGFDEMTMRTNTQVIHDSFRNLAELYSPTGKLIITGRPGYFPDLEEMNRIIARTGSGSILAQTTLSGPPEGLCSAASPYCVINLEPLDPSQVRKVVFARRDAFVTPAASPRKLLSLLRKKYDLSDLARRPVLLDMIITTYAEVGDRLSVASTARLYELYTDLWVQRDRDKGEFRRLVTSEDRKYFAEELAWKMHRESILELHYTEIPYAVEQHFRARDSANYEPDQSVGVDHFSHDIMTCSFLGRDDEGNYKFVHRSFMEFFAAMKLLHELLNGPSSAMGECFLSDEICDFLAELVAADDQYAQSSLRDMMQEACIGLTLPKTKRGPAGSQVVLAASNAISVLSRVPNALKAANLEAINLEGARLVPGTVMREACLSETFLNDVILARCYLGTCTLKNASWQNVDCSGLIGEDMAVSDALIADCSFKSAQLAGSRFRRVTFTGCNLESALLHQTVFEECRFVAVRLKDCQLSDARLVNCDLRNADLRTANLAGAEFTRVVLAGARLRDRDTIGCSFTDCDF